MGRGTASAEGGAMTRSALRTTWAWLAVVAIVVGACSSAATPSPSAAPPSVAASASASAPASGGSAERPPVTGPSCQSGAAEVKFWTSHTPPDSDALKAIVDAFNSANPDVCVKMTIVPGSETDIAKLLTSIRGGVAPDVYMADRFTVPQRAAEGVLDDITNETHGMNSQYL